MADELAQIEQRRDAFIESLIARFERELQGVIASAQARTQADLADSLALSNGEVDRSLANARILRRLDKLFLDNLDRAGYEHLLNELINQFPGELPFFQETLDAISKDTKKPLPRVEFLPRDLKLFADQAFSAKDGLEAVMESVAAKAQQRILLSYGGMPFKDLAVSLSEYLQVGLPQAVGLAATSTATYYRVIADRGYRIIEADLPSMEIRFRYVGPYDLLIRPFCEHLMRVNKTYTRAEIDLMDSGQFPVGSCFQMAGGWRCRHAWAIATD